jgi:hypothetical protein
LDLLAPILVTASLSIAQPVQELNTSQLIERAPAPGWVPEWVQGLGRPESSDVGDEIAKRARSGELKPDEWRRLLESQRVVRTRAKWPRNEPVQVGLCMPVWLRHNLEFRVTSGDVPGAIPIRAGRTWEPLCGLVGNDMLQREPQEKLIEGHGPLGAAPLAREQFTLDLEIRSGGKELFSSVYWPNAERVFKTELSRSVSLVDSIDDAIKPVTDAKLDADVKSAVSIQVHPQRWADSSMHVTLSIGIDRRDKPTLNGIGLGFRVELLRDNAVIRAIDIADASMWSWAKDQWQVDPLPELAARFESLADPKEKDRWRVRVVGDGRLSLSAWDCDRYWAGRFAIPLDELIR